MVNLINIPEGREKGKQFFSGSRGDRNKTAGRDFIPIRRFVFDQKDRSVGLGAVEKICFDGFTEFRFRQKTADDICL